MTGNKRLLPIAFGAVVAATGFSWAVLRLAPGPEIEVATTSAKAFERHEQPSAGLCPWREPDVDIKRFFPGAAGFQDETFILSAHRLEIGRRLGRAPTGDENVLLVHRILRGQKPVGAVITRRARGASGVIEFVLALEQNGEVLGAKLQRLREPEVSSRSLRSASWLVAFRGKTAADEWQVGKDIPAVPAEAASSAEAVTSEVRTALILFDVAAHSHDALAHDHH